MPSHKFNARWVASVKFDPAAGAVDYFDTEVTGLVLRVNRRCKSWRVAFRQGGKKYYRPTIGRYPVMGLAEARAKALEFLVQVHNGRNPAIEKRSRREAGTFAELAAEYMKHHAKRVKRSWREDHRILYGSEHKKKTGKKPHKGLVDRWGDRKVIEIQRYDVRELLKEWTERGAGVMANRVLALLRKMFNYALSHEWPLLVTNPAAGIERPGVESRRDRVLSDREIRALWLATGEETPLVSSLFRLHLLTAQRGGEVKRMSWRELDVDGGWWTIPTERSKNGLPHRVPLSDQVLGILRELKTASNGSQWVFPSPKKSKDQPVGHLQKAVRRLEARTGFEFRQHDLRRTAASHMTSLGIDRLVVSRVLNHAEQGVTAVYDRHSYDPEKRSALDLWARRVKEIIEKEDDASDDAKVLPFREAS